MDKISEFCIFINTIIPPEVFNYVLEFFTDKEVCALFERQGLEEINKLVIREFDLNSCISVKYNMGHLEYIRVKHHGTNFNYRDLIGYIDNYNDTIPIKFESYVFSKNPITNHKKNIKIFIDDDEKITNRMTIICYTDNIKIM